MMTKKLSYFKNQAGISLIEVILVTLIVGFMGLLVANWPSSIKLNGISAHQSLAKQILSKQVEDLRAIGYTNLANGTQNISDNRMSSLPGGAGTIIISDCTTPVCANSEKVKNVQVKITWSDNNSSQQVQIDTLIAKNGLN